MSEASLKITLLNTLLSGLVSYGVVALKPSYLKVLSLSMEIGDIIPIFNRFDPKWILICSRFLI